MLYTEIIEFFSSNPIFLLLAIPLIVVIHYIFKGIKFIFKILFYVVIACTLLYFGKDFLLSLI